MTDAEFKEKDVYLYKAVGEELTVKKGTIRPIGDNGAIFYARKDNGKVESRYQVSATEGEAFNNAVWLSEPDEEAAAKAFIRWAYTKMNEYTAKIRKLEAYICNMKSHIKPN